MWENLLKYFIEDEVGRELQIKTENVQFINAKNLKNSIQDSS